jgi:hypothetical protein
VIRLRECDAVTGHAGLITSHRFDHWTSWASSG